GRLVLLLRDSRGRPRGGAVGGRVPLGRGPWRHRRHRRDRARDHGRRPGRKRVRGAAGRPTATGPRRAADRLPAHRDRLFAAVRLGRHGPLLAAAAAMLLTLGTMNAYYAGTSKLGAALGRDGGFPAWLTRGSLAGEVPRRSLAVLGVLSLAALLVDLAIGVGP